MLSRYLNFVDSTFSKVFVMFMINCSHKRDCEIIVELAIVIFHAIKRIFSVILIV